MKDIFQWYLLISFGLKYLVWLKTSHGPVQKYYGKLWHLDSGVISDLSKYMSKEDKSCVLIDDVT